MREVQEALLLDGSSTHHHNLDADFPSRKLDLADDLKPMGQSSTLLVLVVLYLVLFFGCVCCGTRRTVRIWVCTKLRDVFGIDLVGVVGGEEEDDDGEGIGGGRAESATTEEERRAARKKRREEKRRRIEESIGDVRMVLAEGHFLSSVDRGEGDVELGGYGGRTSDGFDAEEEEGLVRIPISSGADTNKGDDRADGKDKRRKCYHEFPNSCSVCLGRYEPGETIVWSSNPQCSHAFHEGCILKWLMKQRTERACPNCRCDFYIDPDDDDDDDDSGDDGDVIIVEQDDSGETEGMSSPSDEAV